VYVFLVVLPVLGLLGILRSGRHLTAPFSVDGTWKIEAAANRPSGTACSNFLSAVANAPLAISQSGKEVIVTVGPNGGSKTPVGAPQAAGVIEGAGVLEGKTITASFPAAENSTQADCSAQPWTLTATLDPQVEPRTLSGTLSAANCATCAPFEFHAVRQPRATGAGSH
jgi:hypothetical protein